MNTMLVPAELLEINEGAFATGNAGSLSSEANALLLFIIIN